MLLIKNFIKYALVGIFLLTIPFFIKCGFSQSKNQSASEQKASSGSAPNVIFVLADDLGYGDVGINGNQWLFTPNMDQLAREGIRFTDYHVQSTCAPTRAGLMTGMYANHVGVWHTIMGRSILERSAVTVAQMFQSAGYATAIFGKWHLGDNDPYLPEDRGFDVSLIIHGGGVGQSPDYWMNDGFGDTYFKNGQYWKVPDNKFSDDVWFDNAIKFIKDAKKEGKPFFCYIPTSAAHVPYRVPQKYIDMYAGMPNIPHANFSGSVTELDEEIGRLRSVLKDMGISDNTIFIYSTDNGTASGVEFTKQGVIGYNAGMRGRKGSPYEGGHRVPLFMYWKDGNITGGGAVSRLTSYIDIVPTLLDLCNISKPQGVDFDGTSLVPLIEGHQENWLDRTIVVNTQREEHLHRWKDACVMRDNWRLVVINGKKELFDIKKDPGEKNDIASAHPDVIQKLSEGYEKWWKKISVNADQYVRIPVGTEKYGIQVLNSMDAHEMTSSDEDKPFSGRRLAWNQTQVRRGLGTDYNGFWALDVARAGKYVIKLRRYPAESGLMINTTAPEGEKIPGWGAYPEGKNLHIREAIVEINGQKKVQSIREGEQSADFIMDLKKGPASLRAVFVDKQGDKRDAYYVTVKRLN